MEGIPIELNSVVLSFITDQKARYNAFHVCRLWNSLIPLDKDVKRAIRKGDLLSVRNAGYRASIGYHNYVVPLALRYGDLTMARKYKDSVKNYYKDACIGGNLDIIKLTKPPRDHNYLLHCFNAACENKCEEVVRYLIPYVMHYPRAPIMVAKNELTYLLASDLLYKKKTYIWACREGHYELERIIRSQMTEETVRRGEIVMRRNR